MFHKFQKYFTNFWKLNQHMGDVSMTSSLLYLPEPVESLRSLCGPMREKDICTSRTEAPDVAQRDTHFCCLNALASAQLRQKKIVSSLT
jgi:hypothetical protein